MPEYGYMGRSARVDLTNGRVEIFRTPPELLSRFIGGRGLGVALLAEKAALDPFSADMPLIFATGPLVGTASPTSGRMSVVSRSPLTGTVFDSSVGGRFGTAIKRAGFDFLEVTGAAPRWSVLHIEDGNIRIEDATAIAGKNVSELAFPKGASFCAIGRAGENGVLFASIVFDGHYLAGRGGLGAVMGAKKLKAITAAGTGKVHVADPEALRLAREEIMRLLRASQAVFGEFGLSEFGTAALVDLIHARRMEPTRNFRETFFPESSRYSGYALKSLFKAKKTGCTGCPVLCKKEGAKGEAIPEYETASHFGALNGISSAEAIVEANRLCNDYGMDTITCASTLACRSEIENVRLSPEDMLRLVRETGERTAHAGRELAEGSYRYALSRGVPGASISVKGLGLPAYDPRGAYGMALAYATSNRGACHLRAYPITHEILRKPVATDRFSFEGKARMIKIAEDLNAVVDSLTACKFVFFAAGLEEYSKAVSAVTGAEHDVQSLLKAGERIWLLERKLNEQNGFGEAHDDLPERFFTEEGSSGGAARIRPIDRDDFLEAREKYYRIRGYKP